MTRRTVCAVLMLVTLAAASLTSVPASAAVERVDYPGYGIEIPRGSSAERFLKGTPASFKKFVRHRLEVLFRDAGSKPRCAESPTVVVRRYHSGGYARAGEGWYEPCPGGGYAVIYERAAHKWRPILGAQDHRYCQDLAWYAVPRFIAERSCLTENENLVRYRLGATKTSTPSAVARRAVSLVNGLPIVPARKVVVPEVRAQLDALADRRAYLQVGECVTAGDDTPLVAHLGDATSGCEITATFRNDKVESFMARMGTVDGLLKVAELDSYA